VAVLGQGVLESRWNGMPCVLTPALLLPAWKEIPEHDLYKVRMCCFHPGALHKGAMSRGLNPNLKLRITGRHRQLGFYMEAAKAVMFCARRSPAAGRWPRVEYSRRLKRCGDLGRGLPRLCITEMLRPVQVTASVGTHGKTKNLEKFWGREHNYLQSFQYLGFYASLS